MAERVGVRTHAGFLAGDACWRLTRLGRLDEAEPIAERAVAAAPKGMAGVLVFDAAGHLAMRRGRLDEAGRALRIARASSAAGRAIRTGSATRPAARPRSRSGARIPRARGDLPPRALDVVAGSEYVQSTVRVYAAALRALADRALRARALGEERRADAAQRDGRATLERLRTLLAADRWPQGTAGPEPVAFEAVCVAELSRAGEDPDPDAWAAAAERFAALAMPFELAYTRWRQGEALIVAGGDRTAAADALREAAEIAATLPAPLLTAEIEGLARRARAAAGIRGRHRARRPRARAPGAHQARAGRPRAGGRGPHQPRDRRRRSSSPRRPPASTSRGFSPSSACAPGWRRPRPPTASVSCEAAHAPRAAPPGWR